MCGGRARGRALGAGHIRKILVVRIRPLPHERIHRHARDRPAPSAPNSRPQYRVFGAEDALRAGEHVYCGHFPGPDTDDVGAVVRAVIQDWLREQARAAATLHAAQSAEE